MEPRLAPRSATRSRGSFDPPAPAVRESVRQALAEDLLPFGDITASLVPPALKVDGHIASRTEGVLAGCAAAAEVFAQCAPEVRLEWLLWDGEALDQGSVIAIVSGELRQLLLAERTALNYLGHLSGVATLTKKCADEVSGTTRVRDSRKTLPGLRALQKAAVRAGGGVNHRGSLSDAILVKDNHLVALSPREVIARARETWPTHTVQVECETIEQAEASVAAGADAVMLDNMTPAEVRRVVETVNGRCVVEVSGGITLENIHEYAHSGADYIAIGALTHSARNVDIGLDLDHSPPERQTP